MICKLGPPLLKFHYLDNYSLKIWKDKHIWFLCLPLAFQGLSFRLGQFQNDLLICIYNKQIKLQIKATITEISLFIAITHVSEQ